MGSVLEKLRSVYGANGASSKTPTPAQVERAIRNNGNFESIPPPPQSKKKKTK